MTIRGRLAGQGFFEARSFSLISEKAARSLAEVPDSALIALRNPLIDDQAVLRPSLIPGLLAALERNLRGGAKNIRLFELGRVFTGGEERIHLAGLLTGTVSPASWCDTAPRTAGFFDLKGCIDAIGIEQLAFEPASIEGLLPAMRITIGGQPAGSLGQLAPARLRAIDCPSAVAIFELSLKGCTLRGIPRRINPLPRFPAVTRDIALLVDQAVPHARIEEVLRSANEPLLADVQLFDLFSDPAGIRVPAGQKSLAYSLTYRSLEKTLTADEVNAAHARLKERLKASVNVSFRE